MLESLAELLLLVPLDGVHENALTLALGTVNVSGQSRSSLEATEATSSTSPAPAASSVMSASALSPSEASKSFSCRMKVKLGAMLAFLRRTKSYASSMLMRSVFMRYAMTTVTERLTPAWQCTRTRLPALTA